MHEQSKQTYDSPGIILHPLGIVRNTNQEPFLVADRDGISMRGGIDASRDHIHSTQEAISEIILNEDVAGALEGIEEYSHLTVLYWGHKVPEESRHLTRVHPMGRKDIPAVGIFSTCSPARPNPVLATVVRLHARRGNVLEVTGLDAVDKSPVIDIKPYVPEQFPQEAVRIPEWMDRLMKEVRERRV
jgi:tRNA-Thr(GGU) m(6)t(6)A37 methyltransferase TsaA